ncbi:dynamin-2A-like [Phragmites australis]|uniref:dynamin-2A-like n=1 Tax=Phragmites australis TaxID=29695 RepID=UPI002D77B12E|nr:dynamin-2A-like [Phragmites australis]
MEAIEELSELADATMQGAALLADDDPSADRPNRRGSSFLTVVALGNVGAGKSAVLNGLIGHPVLPTGENGATRAPICVELQRDASLSTKSIVLHIDSKSQQVSASSLRHSLQDRLSKAGSSGKGRSDEINMKLCTSTAPPLKLVDLPGIDQWGMDESTIGNFAARNDAILLVIIPALQAPDVASSRALRIARELDSEGTRTIGVLSKVDQAAREQKALGAVQALLANQGPRTSADIQWVATIGHSVAIASAQSEVGSETSPETSWQAEGDSLISILSGAPQSKLGRVALVDSLAKQIRTQIKVRLPNLLNRLQGKSQIVKEELAKLGEQMVQGYEGTRAIALALCREFEDTFLQHISGGEGEGWKVIASFEGKFPTRIKQLPLDRHFDMKNVKRIVLEADGYQPYLISPEKGLRSLIKGLLEFAKEPSTLLVDEVHRVLIEIVSAAANATPGLGRYPPFKREVIAIASAALDGFKNEARKLVIALVDMERAFVPPQHFIRLVQRRIERLRHEDELKNRSTRKGQDAGQKRDTSPQKNSQQGQSKQVSNIQVLGPAGEITAGFLFKKSAKANDWSKRWFVLNEKSGKLGYTKKQEERHFRGVMNLKDCNLEEILDDEEPPRSSKDSKRANVPDIGKDPSLMFKITHKIAYKNVLKDHNAVILKAESMADKTEWVTKMKSFVDKKGPSAKIPGTSEGGVAMRQGNSDGSLGTMLRKPVDPEEELRWISQEVRGYVEAVLSSLAANVPKAVVLCQVEKAKEEMLNQLYTSISTQSIAKIEELIQEDHNVKGGREKFKLQSSLLSKVTRLLSIQDSGSANASWSNDSVGSESSPRASGHSGDEWKSAFDVASTNSSAGATSGNRRLPSRGPPPPPPNGG